jgi:hypothetical protein
MIADESFAPLRLYCKMNLSRWNQNYKLMSIKKTRFDLRLDDFGLLIELIDLRSAIVQRYS